MTGWCSDDGFIDFRRWLISKGRAAYERALVDPDSLIEVSDPDPDYDYYVFEDFGTYTVADVFQELTGQDINGYLGEHHPHPRLQLTWNESDESLAAICPKLTAKHFAEKPLLLRLATMSPSLKINPPHPADEQAGMRLPSVRLPSTGIRRCAHWPGSRSASSSYGL